MVKLTEICEIERVKKDKLYPKDTILIQVSATQGDTILLEEAQECESKYVALTPKIDYEPVFLFESIKLSMDSFLERYKTGPNIQVEAFKFFDVKMVPLKKQRKMVKLIRIFSLLYKRFLLMSRLQNELRTYFLAKMFVQVDK